MATEEPRHRVLVKKVVAIYSDWLNLHKTSLDDFPYTPEHFLDTDVNPFADTAITFLQEGGPDETPDDDRLYMVVVPYDGDDGGPATLYVYAKRDWHWDKPFSEKGRHRVVVDDTYTVSFILQEFDTMFSPVYRGDPEYLFNNNKLGD